MKWIFNILFSILLLGALTVWGQSNAGSCKTKLDGGKYKWAGIDSLLSDPDLYFGFVLIRPRDVNRDFLVKLAKRLRNEYCQVQKLQVVIFDDRRYANSRSLADYADSKGRTILMRGFYSFDKANGEDLLEFSSRFGEPTTVNKVDLTKE